MQGRIQDFKLGGAHLKKLRRAEGGAKIFEVFRVKNHYFTPKNLIFFNFRGARAGCAPWIRPWCVCVCVCACMYVCITIYMLLCYLCYLCMFNHVLRCYAACPLFCCFVFLNIKSVKELFKELIFYVNLYIYI